MLDEQAIKAILGDPRLVLPAVAAVSWLTLLYVPLSYLAVVAPILGVYALAQNRKWVWIPAILLLHPIPAFFVMGLVEYAVGTPHILVDRPAAGFLPRPDRDTRAQLAPLESRFPWRGWVRPTSSNAGVRLATSLFGRASGVYDGYVPRQRDVEFELYGGHKFPIEDFLADRAIVEDNTIPLAPGLGKRIFDSLGLKQVPESDTTAKATAAAQLLEERCLLVFIQQYLNKEHRAVVIYFDAENGRAFSCYSFGMTVQSPDFSYYDG